MMNLRPDVRWLAVAGLCLVSGCAHWGWKHAGARDLAAASDGEATFIETPLAKVAPIGEQPPAPIVNKEDLAKEAKKPEASKPEAAESKEAAPATAAAPATPPAAQKTSAPAAPANEKETDAALVAETLATLKSLPDMSPDEYREWEQMLTKNDPPLPRLAVQQTLAWAKRQQELAKARTAPLATGASNEKEGPDSKPATAATTPAPGPAEVTAAKATDDAATSSNAAPASKDRPLIDRLRQARERSDAPSEGSVFDGKVSSVDAPAGAEVALASAERPVAGQEKEDEPTWDEHLQASISALKETLDDPKLTDEERARHEATLRLLYMLAGQKDDALKAIEGLEPFEQDYWRSQLHSLSISLAPDGTPVKGRRAAIALRPLREAVDYLAAQATLDVKNIALCQEVTIWGNYKEFEKYEFRRDQEVLLYFEVENFTSEPTSKGFATEFVSSYEVFDVSGRRVAEQQFPVAQEVCRNRRRDYFIRYHMHIPKQLMPGDYTLQLTVEDQKGHKFGQGSVKFKVVPS